MEDKLDLILEKIFNIEKRLKLLEKEISKCNEIQDKLNEKNKEVKTMNQHMDIADKFYSIVCNNNDQSIIDLKSIK